MVNTHFIRLLLAYLLFLANDYHSTHANTCALLLGQGYGKVHNLRLYLCVILGYKGLCGKAQASKVGCCSLKGQLNRQAEDRQVQQSEVTSRCAMNFD